MYCVPGRDTSLEPVDFRRISRQYLSHQDTIIDEQGKGYCGSSTTRFSANECPSHIADAAIRLTRNVGEADSAANEAFEGNYSFDN